MLLTAPDKRTRLSRFLHGFQHIRFDQDLGPRFERVEILLEANHIDKICLGEGALLADLDLRDLSRLGFRALLAATLACLMTGAVAGTFYTGSSLLFGR